jgi:phage tail tape-measure protein
MKGAATGAAIGSVVPGLGTAVGAIGGGLLGGFAGLFGSRADQEALEDDPEYQAMKRRERGMSMVRANLGRALQGRKQPANFGEMLNGPA